MRERLFAIDGDGINSIRMADQDEPDDDLVETDDDDDDDFDDEDEDADDEDDEEAAEEAIAPNGKGALNPPAATAIDQPTSPAGEANGRPVVDDGHGIPKL